MRDLFGREVSLPPTDAPAMTPAQRRKLCRKPTRPKGYAWTPGTGPAGETCSSCSHIVRVRMSRTYLKCGLVRAQWSHGPGTDILARSPACAKWEPKGAD
jgi:hypothetical protein